jgi:hypothetical protein
VISRLNGFVVIRTPSWSRRAWQRIACAGWQGFVEYVLLLTLIAVGVALLSQWSS